MDLSELKKMHDEHVHGAYADLPWKAWGSWFSWGSPVGLGLFLLSIGGFLVLLHYAGLF
jgi:hypothetical protein